MQLHAINWFLPKSYSLKTVALNTNSSISQQQHFKSMAHDKKLKITIITLDIKTSLLFNNYFSYS